MSLNNTLFVGWKAWDEPRFSLDSLVRRHDAVRDAVANLVHRELSVAPALLWPQVIALSFTYAFNAFKALGHLLPHRYHESASCILRQMWEVSLNLHWMEIDPERRARDFCGFTVMEMRKQIALGASRVGQGNQDLADFDRATACFQAPFRDVTRSGREQVHGNFSGDNIESRANELGDPWKSGYGSLYRLTSMHAHGAPGAILHPMFFPDPKRWEVAENDCGSLVAIMSIQTLQRNVHLLVRQGLVVHATEVDREATLDLGASHHGAAADDRPQAGDRG